MEVLSIEVAALWTAWLDRHHDKSESVWLTICKEGSNKPSMTAAETGGDALC